LLFAVALAAVGSLPPARPGVPALAEVKVRGPLATLSLPDQAELVRFSPDGKMLLTARSGHFGRRLGPLRLWDAGTGKEWFAVAGDWKNIETILFSPKSSMLAAHEQGGDLKLWDAETGKELAVVSAPTMFTNWVNFCFTPDGRLLAIQEYERGWPDKDFIRLWDIRAKKDVGLIEGPFGTMAISPDSRTAATFTRRDHQQVDRIMLWSLGGRRPGEKLKELKASVDEVAFSPDLATFASATRAVVPGGPTELALWDAASGARRVSFHYDEGDTYIQQLAFLAGGKVLWASGGGGTQLSWHTKDTLWDVTSTPREIGTYSVCPVLSPDGKYIALPKANGADLYLAAGARTKRNLSRPQDRGLPIFRSYNGMKSYPTVTFSPDGRLAAVTELFMDRGKTGGWFGKVARLWDAETGRELLSFPNCEQVMFSPDGKTLATRHREGVVRLWVVSRDGSGR